ncbi:MAG: DNA cytosine methyltransferase [Paludibacteraceae bacterium]|nr:DNA cytosine methyltransferase [Paludibacteraceae bacterium]
MKPFKFIDLFCGIGGFHQAMESLGGECVFASDIDEDCRKTYEANYGIKPAGDITKIDAKDIPAHDVLCGGFPCQAFSKAGNRLGFDDPTKGTLFFDICRILNYHHPKYALLENVRNLASHDHGKTWHVIHNKLDELGYNLLPEPVIFSPHYIGIPQHRERVYIMCVRKDIGKIPPFKFTKEQMVPCSIDSILQDDKEILNIEEYRISSDMEELINLWNEFIQTIKVNRLPGFPIWSDRLCDLDPNEDLSQYPTWKQNFILKNNELYVNNRKYIDEWIERAKKNPLFFGAKAKLEWQAGQTKHPNIWNQIFQLRPSGIRVKVNTYFPALVAIVQTSIIGSRKRFLTPRECARLQSFPESFQPDVKQQQAYKQLGNAVNVELVRYFAQYMFGDIKNKSTYIDKGNHSVALSTKRRIRGTKSKLHEKIRLAKGNAFEPKLFGADGIVAFVNEGFTESSATYRNFVAHNNDEIKVSIYKYNNDQNVNPHLDQYAKIVADALDDLSQDGARVIVMPPLNGEGGTAEDKINSLESGVALWLTTHPESSIKKVFITSF